MALNNFFSKPRIIVLIVLFLLFAAYIITSYGILAFKENTSTVNVSIEVERGSILDKSGKPLAVDTTFYHLATTPSMLEGKEALAALTVAPVTGLEPDTIKDMILSAKSDFLYIKKKLSESQHDELLAAIEKNDLRGLYFDTIPGRIYPENELASQVIGFMGDNGVGSSGIEYTMQDILSPEAPALNDITENTTLRGKNVYLTIDSTLQHKLEDIAADALKTTEAESLMLLATLRNLLRRMVLNSYWLRMLSAQTVSATTLTNRYALLTQYPKAGKVSTQVLRHRRNLLRLFRVRRPSYGTALQAYSNSITSAAVVVLSVMLLLRQPLTVPSP